MKPHRFLKQIEEAEFASAVGALTRISGEYFESDGPNASVGDYCEIDGFEGSSHVLAEVVSVGGNGLRLVPIAHPPRLALGAEVRRTQNAEAIPTGDGFAGRAIDALARPLDGSQPIRPHKYLPRQGTPLAPLDRIVPRDQIETGIRAIDGLLPLGKGQRIGIFAASGVGKTSLMEQLACQCAADRTILCLVGERGREVDKLWRVLGQGPQGNRTTLVAATADESASLRLRAIEQAIGLAEYWRDRGDHVVLLVDSVTRVALALREIGLAAGLPPSTRGLTPNVFSILPRLVERCGASRGGGAITAIFTVLSETDDVDDPVVELMKSVLDGHIVLSRPLAEKRHFPAIDLSRSVSRLSDDLLKPGALDMLRRAHASMAIYEDARAMIESGLYRAGSNADIDRAAAIRPQLMQWLAQGITERTGLADGAATLAKVLETSHA